VSEGQTYSFTVFFGPWQAVLTEVGYISKAPMCAGRLEAVTHWLRYGRFVPHLSLSGKATAEFGFKEVQTAPGPDAAIASIQSSLLRYAGELEVWCEGGDLNPYALSSTSPSN